MEKLQNSNDSQLNSQSDQASLLPNRRQQALTEEESKSIEQSFRAFGYDGCIEFNFCNGSRTRFLPKFDKTEQSEVSSIIVGADIYPGSDTISANSSLDNTAVIAHEIVHHQRWESKREIIECELRDIDEALTSLEAACSYVRFLSDQQIDQLIRDAGERLIRYVRSYRESRKAEKDGN